jgi:hypothetical protein
VPPLGLVELRAESAKKTKETREMRKERRQNRKEYMSEKSNLKKIH